MLARALVIINKVEQLHAMKNLSAGVAAVNNALCNEVDNSVNGFGQI